jgi:hypothetical protein
MEAWTYLEFDSTSERRSLYFRRNREIYRGFSGLIAKFLIFCPKSENFGSRTGD